MAGGLRSLDTGKLVRGGPMWPFDPGENAIVMAAGRPAADAWPTPRFDPAQAQAPAKVVVVMLVGALRPDA
jgi:hypothetical protein